MDSHAKNVSHETGIFLNQRPASQSENPEDENAIQHDQDDSSDLRCKDYKQQLVYGLEDVPPWYATIAFGFQQFLASFGGILSTQFIVGIKMCMSYNTVLMGRFISTGFLTCGVATFLQATFGSRLAVIQGSGSFFVAIFAILDLKGPCPAVPVNATQEVLDIAEEEWRGRILEVSGALMVASLVQMILGVLGCIGVLLRYVGPLTIAPAIALAGLKLLRISTDLCGTHWGIAAMTCGLIILISQYLSNFNIPIPAYNSEKGLYVGRAQFFKLFPIVIAVITTWLFCLILTATGVFPDDPGKPAYQARTDIKLDALDSTPWFVGLYPGQFGTPYVTAGALFGVTSGVYGSMIDSLADYYACAKMSSAPKPPNHAVNRGILVEGISCMLGGVLGCGIGVASYTECIGNIGLTKVGSRVVAQAAGIIMIFLAFFAKVGGLFATLPYPIAGGTLFVGAAFVMAVGISTLQYIDLNSARNMLVVGFALGLGFAIPMWLSEHRNAIQTGSSEVDAILTILLTNDGFIGGMIGCLLDNTIPCSMEERGMLKWLEAPDENDPTLCSIKCYDLPFGMSYIRKSKLCRYLPISPTFEGFPWQRGSVLHSADETPGTQHTMMVT